MFTIRNLGGVALFLFGTTYMWLTPLFAKNAGAATQTVLWSVVMVLCVITMAGFTVATWALFAKASWWSAVAVASAIAGLVVLIPYWVAANAIGEPTPWYNVLIHGPRCRGDSCSASGADAEQLGGRPCPGRPVTTMPGSTMPLTEGQVR